jgi:two-component sensor histidine kinase
MYGRSGVITTAMTQTGLHDYTTIIADNGQGFPSDIDFRNTASPGLQLVNNRVRYQTGMWALTAPAGPRSPCTLWQSGITKNCEILPGASPA